MHIYFNHVDFSLSTPILPISFRITIPGPANTRDPSITHGTNYYFLRVQEPRQTTRCPCLIKRHKPQQATRNHCRTQMMNMPFLHWTLIICEELYKHTHNQSGIHSPNTFYSSCTFGNRLNTYSYHSCLYPNIFVMHQFPDKRKGSNNTVINPFQPVGAFKWGRMWVSLLRCMDLYPDSLLSSHFYPFESVKRWTQKYLVSYCNTYINVCSNL